MEEAVQFADTYQQWPILRYYSAGKVVCEIGVCLGGSSRTFLRAPCKSLTSIELKPVPGVEEEIAKIAHEVGAPWKFIVGDSLSIEPPLCDVLFIDSLHTAEQLSAELERYSPSVGEFIIVHDTGYWGAVGERGGPGLRYAVDDFVGGQRGWKVHEVVDIYPGLTVLGRA